MIDPRKVEELRRRLDEMARRHAREVAELRASLDLLQEVGEADGQEACGVAVDSPAQPPPLPQATVGEVEVPGASRTVRYHTAKLSQPSVRVVEDPPYGNEPVVEVVEPASAGGDANVPPALQVAAREIDFGRVWFVRIGVVILLTGLVFLGNYAYQNWIRELSNGVRLAVLVMLAGLWVETGRRLAKREHLRMFGEVVMAGGLGFAYYCVYAAHHVDRLKVVESGPVAGGLLVAAALAIAVVAWRRDSRITATMGVLLASYTTVLQPIGWLACVSNAVLACTGLFFLSRRGWSAPGWVAMVGMYLAFLLWQGLGAAGGAGEALAVLWFLVPTWLVFAVAGVVPGGGASLSERARAWFAGVNNGLFFMLFGRLWLWHYGGEDFWLVAGVLAVVLIAFGVVGRRTLPVAGAVNLGQGLLLLGLALVLKLDGFHLALAFAAEALVLATAYRRFGGRVEAVFAVLAGIAAAGWICLAVEQPPVWSALVAVFALAVACHAMRVAAAFETRRSFRPFARGAAGTLFWAAWVVLAVGVLLRMERDFSHVSMAIAAVVLGATALHFDRKCRMRELAWGATAILAGALVWLGYHAVEVGLPWWAAALAVLLHLAGAWIWRAELPGWDMRIGDPRNDPRPNGWLHAGLAVIAAWVACAHAGFTDETRLLATMAAALGLAAIAGMLRAGRLACLSGALALAAVTTGWLEQVPDAAGARPFFAVALMAIAVLPLWFLLPIGERIPVRGRLVGMVLFRAAAFLAWAGAMHRALDGYAIDGWAATAVGLIVLAITRRVKLPLESLAFLGIAVAGLCVKFLEQPWTRMEVTDGWRGAVVLAGMLLLVFTHRERVAVIADAAIRARVIGHFASATSVLVALWATQMLVWRAGWDGTVALWSALGLLTVSAGLWQRLRTVRVAGLLLLALGLAKLFAFDVWDYTAFTRVVSFIALGVVLILLGLFYNHFAATLKKWL